MKSQNRGSRMRRGARCISVFFFGLLATAWAQKLVTPGYLFNDDPTCRELNGKFYLFTTQDPFTVQFEEPNLFFKGMYAFHALTTTDFDHWTDHGSIVTGRDVTWNAGQALWDGDAGIPGNGKFYAYAPYRVNPAKDENYGVFDIGVLTADNPLGPYKDPVGGPMKNVDGTPLAGLSPQVVQGDDGARYLLWGAGDTSGHEVRIARLTPDMTQLAEPARNVVVPATDACGDLDYFESPLLFKVGQKWYMTYVAFKSGKGPGCAAKGSYIDYVVGDSMFGPFNGPIRHLIYFTNFSTKDGEGDDNVQQGICSYRGQSFLAYHVPYDEGASDKDGLNLPENWSSTARDHHRQVAVTSLTVLPDGSLRTIYPGRDQGVGTPGVTSLTLDAFAPRREAAEFHARMNAIGEKGLSGEYQLKMGDGGYLRFDNVDFGDGAKTFHVEVSAENATLRNGILEVRLDTPAGELIGKVAIVSTGGPTNYRILTTSVSSKARGIHDLCLVARGETEKPGRLFNVTSFGFTK